MSPDSIHLSLERNITKVQNNDTNYKENDDILKGENSRMQTNLQHSSKPAVESKPRIPGLVANDSSTYINRGFCSRFARNSTCTYKRKNTFWTYSLPCYSLAY